MSSKNDLLNGTILAEVLAYNGEFEQVTEPTKRLLGEKEVGEMSDLEKRIFTIGQIKTREMLEIIKRVSGKEMDDMTDEELAEANSIIQNPEHKLDLENLTRCHEESDALQNLMWSLIKIRIKPESALTLHPGFKIVSGKAIEEIFAPCLGLAITMFE